VTDGPARIEVALPATPYPVLVGRGAVTRVVDAGVLPAGVRRVLLVTQERVVDAGHVAPVEEVLRGADLQVVRHVVPDGEQAKDVATLAELWAACASVPLTRDDLVAAVGGGVVGDLAGFAAATYNRGTAVLQVPTTLLAQVDAAIGGKTGINLRAGKNLVGAFHQPCAVACDTTALGSLPRRLLLEGLGEVVKYGLIADPDLLSLLEAAPTDIHGVVLDEALLAELVHRSVVVKAGVVAADEREGGVRAHLNLGHTYGHVVEALTGYGRVLHGEAVAIGTVVALRLGMRLGRTPGELAERGEALLGRCGLPVRGPELDRDAIWDVMRRDKKAGADGVRFVVLDGLAQPTLVTPSREDVDAVLDELATVPTD
jgi:3-dehydroquinate synthase